MNKEIKFLRVADKEEYKEIIRLTKQSLQIKNSIISPNTNNNTMAYYGDGKYKFLDLIKSCKMPVVKAFLRAKAEDHFLKQDIKNAHIEQWLYNEDFKEIDLEFRGFVKGYLFKSKEYCDADVILGQRELFAKLAKIYKEMNSENNWGKTEKNFKDWLNAERKYIL